MTSSTTAHDADPESASRYERMFCLFMAVVAYLWRDNPGQADPGLLALLSALLGLNLLAGTAIRRWPGRRALLPGLIAANIAVIASILALSGGDASNLWVLYLLPIFSACLFLGRRGVVLVVAAVIAANVALHFAEGGWDETDTVEVLIQGGLFVFAAAMAHRLAARERQTRQRLEGLRASLGRMLEARTGRDSSFTHDLNNVFATVLGFSSLALQEADIPAGVRSDLRSIQEAALKARALVIEFNETGKGMEVVR